MRDAAPDFKARQERYICHLKYIEANRWNKITDIIYKLNRDQDEEKQKS